ncbi:hypothetical protein BDF21DRAFT_400384, partial [Thamnidium elegans]
PEGAWYDPTASRKVVKAVTSTRSGRGGGTSVPTSSRAAIIGSRAVNGRRDTTTVSECSGDNTGSAGSTTVTDANIFPGNVFNTAEHLVQEAEETDDNIEETASVFSNSSFRSAVEGPLEDYQLIEGLDRDGHVIDEDIIDHDIQGAINEISSDYQEQIVLPETITSDESMSGKGDDHNSVGPIVEAQPVLGEHTPEESAVYQDSSPPYRQENNLVYPQENLLYPQEETPETFDVDMNTASEEEKSTSSMEHSPAQEIEDKNNVIVICDNEPDLITESSRQGQESKEKEKTGTSEVVIEKKDTESKEDKLAKIRVFNPASKFFTYRHRIKPSRSFLVPSPPVSPSLPAANKDVEGPTSVQEEGNVGLETYGIPEAVICATYTDE